MTPPLEKTRENRTQSLEAVANDVLRQNGLTIGELSGVGQEALHDFLDGLNEQGMLFNQDLRGTMVNRDLHKEFTGKGNQILQRTEIQVDRLLKGLVRTFAKGLSERDKRFQTALSQEKNEQKRKELINQHKRALSQLLRVAEAGAGQFDESFRSAARMAGEENETIDTYEELDAFQRNFLELMEKMHVREDWMDEMDLKPDVSVISETNQKSLERLKRLEEGEFTAEDYEDTMESIQVFFTSTPPLEQLAKGKNKEDSAKTIDTLMRGIEDTGALTVLHAMDAAERMTLGRTITESTTLSSDQKEKGVVFLVNLDFITLKQAEDLFADLGVSMTTEKTEEIKMGQQKMREFREAAAEFVKTNPEGNILLGKFNRSNVLVGGLLGVAGITGTVLPFLLNIWDPKEWGNIMTDPMWMACAALSGIAVEQVTGGIGTGAISKGILDLTDPPRETNVDVKKMNTFAKLYGNHPETGALLEQALDAKTHFTLTDLMFQNMENNKDENGRYVFRFDQVVQYEKERILGTPEYKGMDPEEAEEKAYDLSEAKVRTRYAGVDHQPFEETEAILNTMFQTLHTDFFCDSTESVLSVLTKIDQWQGL